MFFFYCTKKTYGGKLEYRNKQQDEATTLVVHLITSLINVLCFKEIVHKIDSFHTPSVCSFIGTSLEKCSITSLTQPWILCSEWVPSE